MRARVPFHGGIVGHFLLKKWKIIILNEKYLFGNKFLENNVKVFLVQEVWEGILDLNSGEKYFYIFAKRYKTRIKILFLK